MWQIRWDPETVTQEQDLAQTTQWCYAKISWPYHVWKVLSFELHLKTFGLLGLASKLSDGLSLHPGLCFGRTRWIFTSGTLKLQFAFFAFYSVRVAQRLLPPASSPPCPLSPIYLSPWRKSSWLCELRLLLVTMEAADGKPKTAGSEGSPLIHSRRAGETLQRAGMSHKISCTPSAPFPRLWSSWEEMNTQEKRFFFEFSPGELYQDLSVDGPCIKVVHFKMVQLHDVTYVILKLTGILCSNPFSN